MMCRYLQGVALYWLGTITLLGSPAECSQHHETGIIKQPNIILILADDMGYGDLSVYGHPTQEPGILDKMAAEGVRFTQFYTAAVFCTPSRAAILTGRHVVRSGVVGDMPVFFPWHSTGLPREEVTVAEALQDAGYTTGMVGKWHLGINAYNSSDGSHLPRHHGFDFVGTILPHAMDLLMDEWNIHRKEPSAKRSFLYYDSTLIQQPIMMSYLTGRLVHDAKTFINNNAHQPFFFFFSLPQPHLPMFNHPNFRGKSRRGIYGDQVMEMDWAVNEIIDLLYDLNLTERTLVTFLSDHGPHREMCNESGITGGLKGGKANFYEGAVRVPAIAWWPGSIPSNYISAEILSTLDLYTTFVDIAGGQLPQNKIVDGKSFKDVLLNKNSVTPHEILFFHCAEKIMAVRYQQYKVHYRKLPIFGEKEIKKRCNTGIAPSNFYMERHCINSQILQHPDIYNLDNDPEEIYPLPPDDYKDMLKQIQLLIDDHLSTIAYPENPLLNHAHCDSSLIPCCNPPYCMCHYQPFHLQPGNN